MHGSSHQYPIAWENPAKPIEWKETGILVLIIFPKYGCFFFIRFLYFITWKMYRSSHQYPMSWEKVTKPILYEEPGKLVPIVFPKIGAFVPPDSYPMVCFNTWKIHGSSHQYPIALENTANPPIRDILGNWYPYFSESMCGSFPSDSHLMVCFITREMHRSSHQYPIALEKAAKSILWEEPRKLVPILFPKYRCFYPIRFLSYGALYHMENALDVKISCHGKMHQNTSCGKSLGHWYQYFSQSTRGSLPSDFHPVVCFIVWEMPGFFSQFFIACENAA